MRISSSNNDSSSTYAHNEKDSLVKQQETNNQMFARLRRIFAQEFTGSEELRSLIESKFEEISHIMKEIDRGIQYTHSLEESSTSDDTAHLLERLAQAKLNIDQSRSIHQRNVKQTQNEIEFHNTKNLQTKRKIREIDGQLAINPSQIDLPPNERKVDSLWCDCDCIIS